MNTPGSANSAGSSMPMDVVPREVPRVHRTLTAHAHRVGAHGAQALVELKAEVHHQGAGCGHRDKPRRSNSNPWARIHHSA
jgi:hypothetical protein